ncbi:MAG: S-layer homology domain-containing protein [Oscillospiraceae bacterium]|nr:S-layer homology domain-containing protein [Oscillospiraceae bacterium]
MKNRILSLFLALTMLLTLLPAAASAGETAELRIHADYREQFGTVFYSTDGTPPAVSEETLLRAYNDCVVSGTGTVTFRIDPTVQYGWDGEKDGFMPADEVGGRVISVWARYRKTNGDEVDEWVVDRGEVRSDDVSFSGNVLTWNVGIADYLELRVTWTYGEYIFHTFGPNEENPVMIDVNGGGRGYRQLQLPDGIDPENYTYEPFGYGIKIRVPASTESLTFAWKESFRMERISADGIGADGGWGELAWPEGTEWTLPITSERDWYHVNFEFADNDFGADGNLAVWYDQWSASIFASLGENAPTADPANYLFDSWDNAFNFISSGEVQTVHLLFDTTQGIDWDAWNEREELIFEPRDECEGIYIRYAGYLPDGNWYDGTIVENGVVVIDGFTFEDNILSFTPVDNSNCELHVCWRERDYLFDLFNGTEEAPVVIDVNWWGSGEVPAPAGVAEEDFLAQDGRMRIRVPWTTESLTFTWDGPLEEIGVEGLGEGNAWAYFPPEGDSYTLMLNQTNEWGDPRDRYNIQFQFPDYNWIGQDSKLFLGYDQWSGSVFLAQGENAPDENEECYAAGNNDGYAFTPGQAIHLLIDPNKGIDWEEWDNGTFQLHDREDSDLVAVEARYIDAEWQLFEGTVFENGEVLKNGWTYEDGVLSMIPANDYDIQLNFWWRQSDRDFFSFNGTEEAPVVVEVYWRDGGPVQLMDDVPAEDMLVQDDRMRIRVPFETERLTFSWEGELRELRVMGLEDAGEDGWSTVAAEGNTYTIELNQRDEWGNPETRYNLEFYFVNYDWLGREGQMAAWYDWGQGSVFVALGDEVPAADADHYQPDSWEYPLNFAPDGEPQPIHILIDTSVCADFDKWEHEGVLELVEKEPTDFVAVIARYVDEHFDWVEEPVFQNGTVLKEGWTYEDGILTFTPANDYNIEIVFCFDEGQMVLESFQRTEERPVMVEVEWYAPGGIDAPAGVDAENYVVWENRMRVRVPFETESLTFTWDESVPICRVGIPGTGLYGTWGRTAIEGTSYTLQLDRMDGDRPSDWYQLIFDDGELPPAGSVAVVTDFGGVEDGGFNQAAWEAADAWCAENEKPCAAYTVYGDDEDAYLTSAAQAVSDGFDTLVLPGFMFAGPAATLAETCPEVKIILLDAGLSDLEMATGDENYVIPDNLYAATYADEQSGYLAGYAAVAMGYRKLAFLGGMEIPSVMKYGYGFVQGANDAAIALGCADEIRLDYVYCDQFFPDDAVEAYVDNWFANGTEVVFACGGGIYASAASAAARAGGKFIGVDIDQGPMVDEEFGAGITITSAMKGLGATVTDQLNKIANGAFAGGTDTLGVVSDDPAGNFVALAPTTQFNETFTEADYRALLGKMASGELTVSDNLADRPAVKILVDYNCYYGHDWGEPTYVWSVDNATVTASRACLNEENHIESETVNTVVRTVEATCTTAGELFYTASFENPVFKEQTKTVAVDPRGHAPAAAVKENEVAPTCTEAGSYDEVVYCSVCSAELSREKKTVDALGHDLVHHEAQAVSCTEKGWAAYDTCTRCDYTTYAEIPASGHSPADAVKENEVAPTCTEAGSYDEVVYCSVCGAELSREKKTVDALGHDLVTDPAKPATCTATGLTEGKHCTRCDYKEEQTVVPMIPHSYKDGVCTVCGAKDPNYKPPVQDNPFKDVKQGEFYYDAVLWAVNAVPQVTSGTSVTTFSPDATCTRAQVVTFLWRAKGCPEPKANNNPFKDVKATDYYYKAVLWAVENDITTGTSATTFSPNAGCTRAQVVTFLWRTEGQPKPTSSANPFKDVTGGYYYDAVLWAVEKNITAGTSATTFSPDNTCTRGQIVTFLYRAVAE